MRITVVCTNPGCTHYLTKRQVSAIHLGQDVYVKSMLICACGRDLLQGQPLKDWFADLELAQEQG